MNKSISKSTPSENRTTAKRLLSELPGQDPHNESTQAGTLGQMRDTGKGQQSNSGLHEMRETPEQAPGYNVDEVRRLAYEKFTARGCLDGYDLEDWLAAEREVRDQQNYQGPDSLDVTADIHSSNN